MLRFDPRVRESVLYLAPVIPKWIGRLELDRIPLMGGSLSISVEGDTLEVIDAPAGLRVEARPCPITA